jgi:hypothetical protein
VLDYVSQNYAVKESVYPYQGYQGTCRAANVSSAGALTVSPQPGYQFTMWSAQAIMEAAAVGPVAIYFNVFSK